MKANVMKRAAATALAAVLSLSLGACKKQTPEEYAREAWGNYVTEMNKTALEFPDAAKFSAAPHAQDMTLELEESSVYGLDTAVGASVEVNTKTDPEAKKLSADVSISFAGLTIGGNKLYMDGGIVGFSIPSLYRAHEFITFLPDTFAEDWNASDFGLYAYMDENMNMAGLIDLAFKNQLATAETFKNGLKDMKANAEALIPAAAVAETGVTSANIDGDEVAVRQFAFTIAQDAFNACLQSSFDVYRTWFGDYLDSLDAAGLDTEYMREDYDVMDSALGSVEVIGDVVLTVDIDEKGRVVQVSVGETRFTFKDAYDDELTGTVSLFLAFNGGENLYGSAVGEMTLTNEYDEVTAIPFTCENNATDKLMDFTLNADVVYDGEEVLDLEASVYWDPALSEENFKLSAAATVDEETTALQVAGRLTDTAEELSFRDGVIKVDTPYDGYVTIGVNTGLYPCAAEDVDVDMSDAISLFDLTQEDIYNAMSNLYGIGQ